MVDIRKERKQKMSIMFSDPFANMFRELEAMMDYDFNKESKGLKRLISRPHNLITKKDANGNVESFDLEVVYTPFSKKDVKVEILDGVLTVRCGNENKVKDAEMTYCGISHQSYEFSLPLAENIDTAKISAKAEDGILYISLPVKKAEEKKTEALQIEVL